MSPRPRPVGVGIIGAGTISEQYLSTLERFSDADVRIVGDIALDRAEARARARRHGVGAWGSAKDVLAHDGVETVVNLAIPAAAHADVSTAAVAVGRHAWSEKSLSVEPLEARTLLDRAAAAGPRVGAAPGTVLGPGVQTARRALACGDVGAVLSTQTFIQTPGPDAWHPDPELHFAVEAGPLFDMAPTT
ncbi:Gfo/Idh/MocA family protein [Streptomyces sp. WC2508]|uniref:Gfo/Idh/MocA family protein n=1 Tax=Streptomyces sp. WC2508 TaxID=3461405 RepID=UPI004043E55E